MNYPEGSYNAYNEGDEVGYSTNGAVCGFFGPPREHRRVGSLMFMFFGFLFSLEIASMNFFFILSLFYVTAIVSCLLSCRLALFCPIEELDFWYCFIVMLVDDSKKDSKKDRPSSGHEVDRTLSLSVRTFSTESVH
jgi:hypothetical protein